MSVRVTRKPSGEIEITLANGHADALDKVKRDYHIIDDNKTVGFMLSVMRDADGLAVETVNGSFVPITEIVLPIVTPLKTESPKEDVTTNASKAT
ncbi:MAG TPA: hypothetical protein VJJ55_03260 [Candidatus Paceibacterota bacterium]